VHLHLTDDVLMAAHPGTFAHRIRAVDVLVDAPGTAAPARGILSNSGFSLLRREPAAPRVPLLRFADAYPISEFRLRTDMGPCMTCRESTCCRSRAQRSPLHGPLSSQRRRTPWA
jgi:hypothetical protein